jgi:hypothetical protein
VAEVEVDRASGSCSDGSVAAEEGEVEARDAVELDGDRGCGGWRCSEDLDLWSDRC